MSQPNKPDRRRLTLATAVLGAALVVFAPAPDVAAQVKVKLGVNSGFKKSVGFNGGFSRFSHGRFNRFHHGGFNRFGHSRSGHFGHAGFNRSRYPGVHRRFSSTAFVVASPTVRERTVVIREPSRASRFDDRAFVTPRTAVTPATPDPYAARAEARRVDPAERALDALADGDWAFARSAFANAASANPDRVADKIGFGLASALQGDHETAAFAFDRARRIADDQAFRDFPLEGEAIAALRDRLDRGVPDRVAEPLALIADGATPDNPYNHETIPPQTSPAATQPAG